MEQQYYPIEIVISNQFLQEKFMAEIRMIRLQHLGELLEQPGSLLWSAKESHRVLLTALDSGWQVEQPVYLRLRNQDKGPWVYHFILRREYRNQTQRLAIYQNREIDKLIYQQGWLVESNPAQDRLFENTFDHESQSIASSLIQVSEIISCKLMQITGDERFHLT